VTGEAAAAALIAMTGLSARTGVAPQNRLAAARAAAKLRDGILNFSDVITIFLPVTTG
jgi:hypothetical protein